MRTVLRVDNLIDELNKSAYSLLKKKYESMWNEIETLNSESEDDEGTPSIIQVYGEWEQQPKKKRKVDYGEVESYLKAEVNPGDKCFDWWRKNQIHYPVLAQLAQTYLCIQTSSSSVERLFSKFKDVCVIKRNRMRKDTLEAILFCKMFL
jgi:hypothetical protein